VSDLTEKGEASDASTAQEEADSAPRSESEPSLDVDASLALGGARVARAPHEEQARTEPWQATEAAPIAARALPDEQARTEPWQATEAAPDAPRAPFDPTAPAGLEGANTWAWPRAAIAAQALERSEAPTCDRDSTVDTAAIEARVDTGASLPEPGRHLPAAADVEAFRDAGTPQAREESARLAEEPGAAIEAAQPQALQRALAFLQRVGPWASLALSIAGAVSMDRSEERGPVVALSAALAWVALMAAAVLYRPSGHAEQTGNLKRVVRFFSFAASQSLSQLCLFFSAPFYVAAFGFTTPQLLFLATFAVVTAAVSWDPLALRVFLHPWLGPATMAFCSFAAAAAALPMLGVTQKRATVVAAVGVGLLVLGASLVRGETGRRRGAALACAIATPLLVLVGAARIVPPAPLRLVSATLATGVVDRQPVGASAHFASAPRALYCWTAIGAPLGLTDALFHEWRRNGELVVRMPLSLKGGRRRGFRTWSRLRTRPNEHGSYRCDVVTSLGQTLGGTSGSIGE
jgi:hypothetical protein